ncbi:MULTISPECIES: DUF1310 family protein [Streptococcus]|uniref:DUF1310 family protein n=1 Tax=Streptococcus iners subsp. hyiners TaxID=3028083 RepID=A0AA97A310_9STRE|nr:MULTISPECIES: DUF1310 family protein [Streptococcus]MCK4029996.1 DUF1310 family protein [Streptococcus suis]WNY49295.1 DUF1310 family protein [Streptococcus sp. 29892]
MKKVVKILVGVIIAIALGIGGIGYMQHKEHEEMVAIATSEEAKAVYKEMILFEDPEAFTDKGIVTSYTIDTDSLYYNPMGGMEVTLFINGEKELEFQCGIVENDKGQLESTGYVYTAELSELFKEGQHE